MVESKGRVLVVDDQPDILLLDIMMPDLDGYEVTARLKADPELKIIPIVLLTDLEGVEDKVKGLNAGADDFLSKPVNQPELLARIRSLYEAKQGGRNRVCVAGAVATG
ncbi:MAG: response regulator [Actinobacteria bacterium]|nr:response regulator [Actinomycetota bacterium]